ncbi:carbohydrate binding domain-containing protein [Kitasatospora sp. NPDC004240]
MRAPTRSTRPTRRRGRRGLPLGLAAAVLALTGSTLGLAATSATAALPDVELIVNGGFNSYPWIWNCEPNTSRSHIPHEHYMSGRPTADSYAGCTQKVRVLPNSTYTLSASVRGPYAFVGVTGTGAESVATWSNQTDWNGLTLKVTTGPDTTQLTVYFHGWYEQGPYDVRWMSFNGPGVPPSPCGEPSSGSAPPSATPSCMRTYIP